MLVFSTTDRESFEAISSWREKVVAEVGDIPTALVQNKIDLLDDSCIKLLLGFIFYINVSLFLITYTSVFIVT